MRYEYRVRPLPLTAQNTVNVSALEQLLNEQGQEEFEIVHMSVKDEIIFFQKNVYDPDRRSEENIEQILAAVKSYGDVHDLEFMLVHNDPSESATSPRVVSDDEAWRFLIDRILGES